MRFLIAVFLLTGFGMLNLAMGFTSIQTSSSAGIYSDYQKRQHYPFYQSWSLRGIFESGLETSIEIYLNNDFASNQWTVFSTQAEVSTPVNFGILTRHQAYSKISFGRQLFVQGFDLALLDGVQMPLSWSETGGVMPILGSLHSTDFDQTSSEHSEIMGLIFWEKFMGVNLRGGFTGRDSEFKNQFAFGSAQLQFENLLWSPSLFLKGEWIPNGLKFNQSYQEIHLRFSETVNGRLAYSNFEPRTVKSLAQEAFVYRLFAISPTESAMADVSWSQSDDLILKLGGEISSYSSDSKSEVSDRQDLSADYRLASGNWISPSFTHLQSYGGEMQDFGLKYTSELSTLSKLIAEFDLAYFKKINQIQGWAQSLRGTYETHFWDRAKVGLGMEIERNHYFVFDTRVQVYVTNYL